MIHRALSNLRNFSSKHKVKQAALGYLVQHFMSMSEKAELEQVFTAIDTSGDGKLSKDELLDGYRKYYGDDFNEAEVDALLSMADSSSDGLIGISEFMLTCVNTETLQTHAKLEAVFNELDIDKNHRISLDELNQFLGSSEHMDKEALAEAFAQVDPGNTGEITFSQF